MRLPPGRALFGLLFGLLFASLAATGCHTYKYFDVNVTLDPNTFSSNEAFRIHTCHVFVSGQDNTSFYISKRCPPPSNDADPYNIGTFEFSSFAESGSNTFRMTVFENLGEKPQCLLGEGMVTVEVTGAMTLPADLKVMRTAGGCPNGPGPISPDGFTAVD